MGDLHGRKPRILFDDFDAIIAPGDVCWDAHFRGETTKWIRSGLKLGWGEHMQKAFGKRRIKKIRKANLARGRKVMEYLNSFGVPVYFVPGNWDQSQGPTRFKNPQGPYQSRCVLYDNYSARHSNPLLTQGLENVVDCQLRLVRADGLNIVGYGLSSNAEHPAPLKRRVNKKEYLDLLRRYKKLQTRLSDEYRKRNRRLPTLLLTHNVPHDTSIDVVDKPGTPIHGKHFGSTIARTFCDKYQPLLCIGGHMHEHFGRTKIGKTTAINAGFGPRVNVLVNISGKRLRSAKFREE